MPSHNLPSVSQPEAIDTEAEKEAPGAQLKDDKEAIAAPVGNAEQWVDPWMRRQPQQNRSPEIRSPQRKSSLENNLSSVDSSDSDAGINEAYLFIYCLDGLLVCRN